MDEEKERGSKKLKYPKSVFFIVCNELCERFSYYGMRAILTLYLRNKLNYPDDMVIVIYHTFTMFVYFFPLLGAMLADSLLGKFRTIFYVSIIYAVGQLLLALSAAPAIGLPARDFSLIGLLLIAIGTGGIKPCVAAFGGDQFVLPQQERYLSMFFSVFYFSINFGSLLSSFLTPMLRSDIKCFGETTCYSLAFLVPAVLMALSIVIFVAGKPLYRMAKPSGNVVLDVTKCVSRAVYNKATSKGAKKEHWLDHADDKYDRKLIDDIKDTLQVLKLFIPLPVFWALFDQQGSKWTIQATRMTGEVGSYLIQPDQMQVANPLLVLAFIPLFETCVYPLLKKLNLHSPLKKLTIGGLLASLSFVVSALVELQLEKTYPILPSQGLAQVRLFNTLNCPVGVTLADNSFVINGLDAWNATNIPASGEVLLKYSADFTECQSQGFPSLPKEINGIVKAYEARAVSAAITPAGTFHEYVDKVDKSETGNPLVRALVYLDPTLSTFQSTMTLRKDGVDVLSVALPNGTFAESELAEIEPATYDVLVNGVVAQAGAVLRLGGVYGVIGAYVPGPGEKYAARTVTVTEPNSMHILWLLPQYVVITMGEVMFSVTGLEFAFTQAPTSMKSLLQASWLLTVAFGNLIVVIIAKSSVFERQVFDYVLFASLMFVDIIIFAVMAKFYKYVKTPDDESVQEDIGMEVKNGTVNPSYKDDEK